MLPNSQRFCIHASWTNQVHMCVCCLIWHCSYMQHIYRSTQQWPDTSSSVVPTVVPAVYIYIYIYSLEYYTRLACLCLYLPDVSFFMLEYVASTHMTWRRWCMGPAGRAMCCSAYACMRVCVCVWLGIDRSARCPPPSLHARCVVACMHADACIAPCPCLLVSSICSSPSRRL